MDRERKPNLGTLLWIRSSSSPKRSFENMERSDPEREGIREVKELMGFDRQAPNPRKDTGRGRGGGGGH